MGIDVVQGPTQFRVPAHKTRAFERIFEGAGLDDYWTLVKDEQGVITALELQGLPGRPCDGCQMALLTLFVEDGRLLRTIKETRRGKATVRTR